MTSDATGRNALYKIHISLGKIVNSLTEKTSRTRKSSAAPEEKTSLGEDGSEESTMEKIELVKVEEKDEAIVLADEAKAARDSLVEELLSDDDMEASGV